MKQASWIFIVGACVVTAGCGQKGALYLPDKNASVVTRPAGSGATATAPAAQPAPASGTPAPDGTTSAPATTTPAKPPQDKNGNDDSQSATPKG